LVFGGVGSKSGVESGKNEDAAMPEFQLTKLLNLPNQEVVQYEMPDLETAILEIKSRLEVAICPTCQTPSTTIHDYDEPRLVRDLSLSGRKSYLRYHSRRFECAVCQQSFTERVEWLNFDSSYTQRFEEHVYQLCRKSTVQDVSTFLDLGYDAVEGIFQRWAKKRRRRARRSPSGS
jgi:transposase